MLNKKEVKKVVRKELKNLLKKELRQEVKKGIKLYKRKDRLESRQEG